MNTFRRFFAYWQNWIGILLVLLFLAMALAAPLLAPVDKNTTGSFRTVGRVTDYVPHPPNKTAVLGTLPGQVDVYHTLIWGARDAIQFGLAVVAGAFLFGVFFGAISGYAGGMVNNLMMRLSDAFLTFPLIAGVAILQQMVAITIEAMGGTFYFNTGRFGKLVYFQFTPPLWVNFLLKVDPLLVCLIIFSWVPYARIVNAIVVSLKRSEFIQAAEALGGGPFWIIRRHLLPNSIGPALVLAARDVGNAVILQATFTFIGLGSFSSWGTILSMGRDWVIGAGGNIFQYWWVFIPTTLAVMLFGIAWNIIGDGLSDAFNLAGSNKRLGNLEEQPEPAPNSLLDNRPVQPLFVSPAHPETQLQERNKIILQTARQAVLAGNLLQALEAYGFLIKHARSLDEIEMDLAALARRYPGEPLLWKSLGDVLAKLGNQEFAHKAYLQADLVMKKRGTS